MDEDKYDSTIPAPTADGFNDPTIKKALEIMQEWSIANSTEFTRREYLNTLADEAISNSDSPMTTNKKINNQLSYIAVRKVNKQMAERIFKVTGGNISADERAVIKRAYIRFLELAGYRETWLDNLMMLRTGDQFITAGANEQYWEGGKGFPFHIFKKSVTQLFFPGWATALTDKGDNRHARKYVEIVFDGEWDTAIEKYPWLEDGGTSGTIPVEKNEWSLTTQTEQQRGNQSPRRTQVARFIDEDKKIVQYFGGKTCVIGQREEGEEFPHLDRFGESTKNIFQKKCFPLSNGMLATGILQATHKLSVLDGILQSIGFTYEIINLNAIKIVRTGMNPEDFKKEYTQALRDQMNLREGVIYSKEDIGFQSTHGQSFLQEMFSSIEQIVKDFARLDIIIDDALTDPGKTLGALEIEQVSQSRGIRELQKQNAPEEQRFHDFVTDWIIQNIEEDCDCELPGVEAKVFDKKGKEKTVNGQTIPNEYGEQVFVNFTIGDLAEAVRKNGLRFEIVPESGIKINEAVSRQRAEQNLVRYASLGLKPLVMQELKRIKTLDGESEADLELLERQEIPEGVTGQGLPPAAPTGSQPIPTNV